MKDERGLYYHPEPGNARARVYVRANADGAVEFRLWQADQPEIWEGHQWITMDVIRNAARLYTREGRNDPTALYDMAVARALLAEEARESGA